MGTKYIIEVEDKPFELLSEDGFTSEKLFRVKGFNSLMFDWNGLNMLTPYTEPDLEQVRKDAYEQGWKEAEDHYDDGYSDGYDAGLDDAWKAARKIVFGDINIVTSVFDTASRSFVIRDLTAAEVIEKLKVYEQERDAIKVGDEVTLKCGAGPAIYMQGTKGSDEIYLLFNDGSCGQHSKSEIVRKTGRHFPEIATILEKMGERHNG